MFGRFAGALERVLYRDSRVRGLWFTGLLVSGVTGLGYAISSQIHQSLIRVVVVSIVTWVVLGGTSLIKEANAMALALEKNDLSAARTQLGSLCGRDATFLDANALARATVESVAENTSDAVVAPLFWGALLGIPGLLAYRGLNTLDAMVGHRSPRYARFGMASARLDDFANFIPARFSGFLAAIFSRVVGGSLVESPRVMLSDGRRHPSPNAGQVEAAFAGALGLSLGGINTYAGIVDDRPQLGRGRVVEISDISRANRLSRAVQVGAVLFATLISIFIGGRP
ncbi:cobalamin biosynthesis protein CbiB [mine drainage metagenome]|uniref:Cobalamin biosynthesis protein CbiB n=1 Tax=mine drainage metagenome TaxID=410659 RepID=A0A1J5Q7L8_9ZZZZ